MNKHILSSIKFFLVVIGIAIFTSCTNSAERSATNCSDYHEDDWQTVKVESANYKIDFPNCELKQWSEIMIYASKEVEQNYIDLNLQEQESNCFGYGFTYHPIELPSERIEIFLSQEGKLNEEGLKAELEIEKKLNKFANSREFIYNMPNDLVLRQRIVVADNIVYKWSVVTSKEKRFNKSVTKFLNSFELLN